MKFPQGKKKEAWEASVNSVNWEFMLNKPLKTTVQDEITISAISTGTIAHLK